MSEKPVKKEDLKAVLDKVRLLFPHLAKVKDEELIKAVAVAKHLGLDPTKKEVHFVPYSGSVQLIVSYTEYIKRAEKSGKLNGWQVDFGKDSFGEYAEVTIYRKDWDTPFKWKVYMEEAKQKSPTWEKMPKFMLRKVAIAQGFRLAFPEETAELPYEEAEFEAVTPPKPVEYITEKQIEALYAIQKKRGIDLKKLVEERWGLTSIKDLTKEKARELIMELNREAEEGTLF